MDTRENKLKIVRLKRSIFFGILFFVVSLMTLTGYGINWDTINHLPRGQAYLHYFLTGRRDYSDLPKYFNGLQKPGQWYFQDPDYLRIKTDQLGNFAPSRSVYQIDAMNFDYFLQTDGDGHPPLSDILSSLFNEVLFRRLKLINDVDSYHVYGIFLASITVALVFYWGSQMYGQVSGLVAALALVLYPLFWSESHFNTEKDVPETAYWSLFMFSFWKGVTTKNWKWIIFSGVLFGLALGTKLNIIFSVMVIAPWFFIQLFRNDGFVENIKSFIKNKKVILSLILIPVIGFGILISTWPYLWGDPVDGVLKMVGFYKTIGTTNTVSASFFWLNLFPIKWIFYTTPIVTLFLTFLGIIFYIFNFRKDKSGTVLLFLFWLITPILRVVTPGSNIYGGVRQIMEFVPAMALVSGYAFSNLTKTISNKLTFILSILIFVPIMVKIVSIYPNENVYFNPLVGGLKGAKEEMIKFWGFSFGSSYRQAASWINKNVPEKAIVAFTYDLSPNLPRIWMRTDLNLSNGSRSGYLRQGEYAMGLIYDGTDRRSYYDMYLDKFIEPVYQIKVDNTAILKVWKNDIAHLKVTAKENLLLNTSYIKDENHITFDLKSAQNLSRLEVKYNDKLCSPLKNGSVYISKNGTDWNVVPGSLPDDWYIGAIGIQPKNGSFITPFVGQEARYIKLNLDPINTCLLNVTSYKIFVF